MKPLLLILLSCLPTLLCAAGEDSPLRDPTRPPGLDPGFSQASGAQGPRLDAVKRIRSGKALALINGVPLHVGDEIQGLRLVSITGTGVVLEGPEGRQELRLTPAVERSLPGRGATGGK
ncbi:hypothetical protein [Azovibrio restrictus]|uniref:hypothetical protein n=1 Tax=Azovibrio restrictus TaxID=146938 RepID=UPI0026EF1009|nr:hypothetical protein [Azovibrio restrictus]